MTNQVYLRLIERSNPSRHAESYLQYLGGRPHGWGALTLDYYVVVDADYEKAMGFGPIFLCALFLSCAASP